MCLELTLATEADLPAIVELMNVAYRGTGANASWNTEVVFIDGDRTTLDLLRGEVVNVRDTLIAWYGRRGYRLTGETRPFPYGDTRFGKPRRDDLNFVVLEKSFTAPPR